MSLRVLRSASAGVPLNPGTLGTGFLVGPDLVLTNYHVLNPVFEEKDAVRQGELARKITCRFDFRILTNGSTPDGVCVGLDRCPPTPEEMRDDVNGPAASEDQLDYGLIRLVRRIGEERGWVRVPERQASFDEGAPLMIVQYPFGLPIKLALDTEAVIQLRPNGTRVRYATNTESGSPVFDVAWRLVALHLGEPAKRMRFNQGIPVAKIRARLARLGLVACLDTPLPTAGPPPAPQLSGGAAMRLVREAFANRRPWFDRLNAFKRLHGVLHNLLMRKPGLEDAVALFRADPTRPLELVRMANALEAELLGEARAANAQTGAAWKSEPWIESLARAAEVLRTDALRADPPQFDRAIDVLRNLPHQKQSALDREISQCAIQLGPEELAALLDDVVASPDQVAGALATPDVLGDFPTECRRLGALTRDHALCQEAETALAAVPAEDAARSRVPRWPDVLAQLHQIAARRPRDPLAAPMLAHARAFDEAADGRAASDASLFLYDQFGFLFKKLDRELLDGARRRPALRRPRPGGELRRPGLGPGGLRQPQEAVADPEPARDEANASVSAPATFPADYGTGGRRAGRRRVRDYHPPDDTRRGRGTGRHSSGGRPAAAALRPVRSGRAGGRRRCPSGGVPEGSPLRLAERRLRGSGSRCVDPPGGPARVA